TCSRTQQSQTIACFWFERLPPYLVFAISVYWRCFVLKSSRYQSLPVVKSSHNTAFDSPSRLEKPSGKSKQSVRSGQAPSSSSSSLSPPIYNGTYYQPRLLFEAIQEGTLFITTCLALIRISYKSHIATF